jgi:type I restriction enzyme S subunit
MSKIDELVRDLCPEGVNYRELDEILIAGNASTTVPKKEYKKNGKYPIIDQSMKDISGYSDDVKAIPSKLPCIIFGDHTRIVKYASDEFAQGDSGTKVFVASDKYESNIKYIYYCFSNLDIPSRGYNRHWSLVKKMLIPVPPIEIQNEIVRILDNFFQLELELKEELEMRTKQFDYFINKLLDFSKGCVDYPKIDKMISVMCPDGVKYVSLAQIGTVFFRGKGIKRDELVESGFPCVRYGDIYTKYNYYFSEVDTFTNTNSKTNNKYIESGDILFAVTGETIEEIGKSVAYVGEDKLLVGGDIAVMRHQENPKFLAYLMSSQNVIKQKISGKVKSKVVHMSVNDIKSLVIPLPPLEIQKEIVLILDTFNEYVMSNSSGLPAEILSRRIQYEYFRKSLLSF